MTSAQRVTIRVPASTSNLGPGFDCLGVALKIYNEVTVVQGVNSKLPRIATDAAKLFFKRARLRAFDFSSSTNEHIPRMRGLGSSATIRLGILEGLNQLSGVPLDRWSIFRLCADLEGHPDNAAPSWFGGFTIVHDGMMQRFEVHSRLRFVLLIPGFEINTVAARKILPSKISRVGAVESCRNACAITAAFASRGYEKLRGAFADQLHQPYRTKLIPMLPMVVAAAEKAGALGAFLSGSGSAICAITLRNTQQIAAAMQRAAKSTSTRTIITSADNRGVRSY
jgi:homoserine kinase